MKIKKIVIPVIAMLVGCTTIPSGDEEFAIAEQLAGNGQYPEAIAYIGQALQKAPESEVYIASLSRYRQGYSEQITRDVNSTLSATVDNEILSDAEILISQGRSVGVSDTLLGTAIRLLAAEREGLYSMLSRNYQQATIAITESRWNDAFRLLTDIETLFERYEDVGVLVNSVRQSANTEYLKSAAEALENEDLRATKATLGLLLQIDPNNNIAQSMLVQANRRDNKEYYLKRAKDSFGAGDRALATSSCSKVLDYDSFDVYCKDLVFEIQKLIYLGTIADIKLLHEAGMLFEAGDRYFELLNNPQSEYYNQFVGLGNELVERLSIAARDAKDNNNFGVALQLYDLQSKVRPSLLDTTLVRSLQDSIDVRVRKSIAVRDFSSPNNAPDAGAIMANNLISNLFRISGNDVGIFEREEVRMLLEEIELDVVGSNGINTSEEQMGIYGIDIAIIGSVLRYQVDTEVAESSQTIRYQVDEKIEDNIDYLNWIARNPNPSRQQLAEAPPAMIMVPTYTESQYLVRNVKKVAFVEITFRIVDTNTSENTRVDTLEISITAEDTSNEGVREAGIEIDLLVIKTDTELLQESTAEIVRQLSTAVLQPLINLEQVYFNDAEEHEDRAEMLLAVEKYTDTIADEAMKSTVSPLTTESNLRISRILHAHSFDY